MKAMVLLMSDSGDLLTAQSLDVTAGEGVATRLVWMGNQSRPEPEMVMESRVEVHIGAKAEELRAQIQRSMNEGRRPIVDAPQA